MKSRFLFVTMLSLWAPTLAIAGDPPLTNDEVKHVVDGKIADLKVCLKTEPSPTGKLVVHYVIMPSGKVDKPGVAESSTGNHALDKCIVEVFRHLTFPAPRGGAMMEQLYPFTFAAPKVVAPTAKLDPKVVVDVVTSHQAEIQTCAADPKNANRTGTITVELDITSTGAVSAARKKESSTNAETFDACVLAAAAKWQFPKPEGQGALTLALPIALSAKKPAK